jgi:protein-S-isoprenylcysteine O-methyltransferase Ste14
MATPKSARFLVVRYWFWAEPTSRAEASDIPLLSHPCGGEMKKEDLVALFHALSGAGAMVVGLLTKAGLPGSTTIWKALGYSLFALGMLLFTYAAISLKRAFSGNVAPITDELVTAGPYRLVRHPLYLSMIIAVVGLCLALQSIWGLVIAFGLFFPLSILRGSLEESSLRAKFGYQWQAYAERTRFLIPGIW